MTISQANDQTADQFLQALSAKVGYPLPSPPDTRDRSAANVIPADMMIAALNLLEQFGGNPDGHVTLDEKASRLHIHAFWFADGSGVTINETFHLRDGTSESDKNIWGAPIGSKIGEVHYRILGIRRNLEDDEQKGRD
jgi:hypothetical protein